MKYEKEKRRKEEIDRENMRSHLDTEAKCKERRRKRSVKRRRRE